MDFDLLQYPRQEGTVGEKDALELIAGRGRGRGVKGVCVCAIKKRNKGKENKALRKQDR